MPCSFGALFSPFDLVAGKQKFSCLFYEGDIYKEKTETLSGFHPRRCPSALTEGKELIWNSTKSLQEQTKKPNLFKSASDNPRDLIYKDILCWPRGTPAELMESSETPNMIRVN